jgi:tRNA dimethylallyltransferase
MRAIAIVGPTAAGKSAAGMVLAEQIGGEIVSIDSRQVYRGLDIGTAKPGIEERRRIPHHCIDVLDLTERGNAEWFAGLAREAIRSIAARSKVPVLVGGSGFYLRAVIHGLFPVEIERSARRTFAAQIEDTPTVLLYERLALVDPASSARIHPNDRYRIVRALEVHDLTGTPLSEHFRRQERVKPGMAGFTIFGLAPQRGSLRRAIRERTVSMYDAGWPGEVSALLEKGADPAWPGMQTLGYPEIIAHIDGRLDRTQTLDSIAARTARYAKRQMTWFRKEPIATWIDPEDEDPVSAIRNILDMEGLT